MLDSISGLSDALIIAKDRLNYIVSKPKVVLEKKHIHPDKITSLPSEIAGRWSKAHLSQAYFLQRLFFCTFVWAQVFFKTNGSFIDCHYIAIVAGPMSIQFKPH